MRICNYCGSQNQDNATVCQNCGGNLNAGNSGYRSETFSYQPESKQSIPEQYRPLSPWAYFGYGILFSLPLVGFILLLVFSFNSSNINRRNYARSYFCMLALVLIIILIVFIISLITGTTASLFDYFSNL